LLSVTHIQEILFEFLDLMGHTGLLARRQLLNSGLCL